MSELILYTTEDGRSQIKLRAEDQTVWLTQLEMAELFEDIPEALANSVEIARRCNLRLDLGKVYLPDYPVAHDTPLNYDPLTMQWSMDGGNVQVHVPLSALAGVLKPQYGG